METGGAQYFCSLFVILFMRPSKSIYFILLFFMFACKKQVIQGEEGPQGAQGAIVNGFIAGNVRQVDESNILYTNGLNTTTISILGTNLSAITDSMGNYKIQNVPPGIYDLAFNKPYCGEMQIQQLSFPGNGTYYLNDTIHDKATFNFIKCTVQPDYIVTQGSSNTTSVNKLIMELNLSNKPRGALLILGNDSTLEITKPNTGLLFYHIIIPANVTSQSFIYNSHSIGYHYARLYPNTVGYNNSGYYNFYTGKMVYPNVGVVYPEILHMK